MLKIEIVNACTYKRHNNVNYIIKMTKIYPENNSRIFRINFICNIQSNKTKLNIYAVHSSRFLQFNLIFDLSHASLVKYSTVSNGITLYNTEKSQTFKNDLNPFLLYVFHNDCRLHVKQNNSNSLLALSQKYDTYCCRPAVKSMTPNFVVFVNVYCQSVVILNLHIFVEKMFTLLCAMSGKWA